MYAVSITAKMALCLMGKSFGGNYFIAKQQNNYFTYWILLKRVWLLFYCFDIGYQTGLLFPWPI